MNTEASLLHLSNLQRDESKKGKRKVIDNYYYIFFEKYTCVIFHLLHLHPGPDPTKEYFPSYKHYPS